MMDIKEESEADSRISTNSKSPCGYNDTCMVGRHQENFSGVKAECVSEDEDSVLVGGKLFQPRWFQLTNPDNSLDSLNNSSTCHNISASQYTGAGDGPTTSINVSRELQQQIKLYACSMCQYSCNLYFDLYKHTVSHYMVKSYMCDLCQFSFGYFPDMKNHLVSHVADLKLPPDLCDGSTEKHHLLQEANEKSQYSHSDEKGMNLQVVSHVKEKPLQRERDKKRYFCNVCDYTCSQSSDLRTHQRKHTGEKPYSCDLCDYTCAYISNLKSHRRIHTGEKPHFCDKCDFTCTQSSDLKRHQRTHTGEKPYSCSLCDYTCTQSSHLTRHQRKHTGEKPYACGLCDYTCARWFSLKCHQSKHTGEKPYICDLCGYTCAHSSHLKRHLKTHTAENKNTQSPQLLHQEENENSQYPCIEQALNLKVVRHEEENSLSCGTD